MTIQDINAHTVTGKLKLKLKNGKTLIGSLPFDSHIPTHLLFLPHEFSKEFSSKFKVGQTLVFEEIKPYIIIIEKSSIDSFELFESNLKGFNIENGKPLPNWIEITCTNNGVPGSINIKYKIPDTDKWFDLGELKIQNGIITIPITFVFLSYSKEDKEIVQSVMDKLHNNGVITWYDEKDLLPGDDWEAKIEESIEKADHVLIFLSSKTTNRIGYKNKEINYILNQYLLRPSSRRYIIPILIDDFTPPREFKKMHWLKMSEDNWLTKLLAAMGKN